MGESEAPEGVSQEEDGIDAASDRGDDEAKNEQLAQASIILEETPEKDDEDGTDGDSIEEGEVGEKASETEETSGKARRFVDLLHKSRIVILWTFLRRYRRIALGLSFGLGVIALSITLKCELLRETDNPSIPPVHVYVTLADRELTDIVSFRKFFILRPEKDRAYLSVDVSVITPNERVYREIQSNRARFRSIVYESMKRAIDGKKWSGGGTDILETHILKALNGILHSGRVEEIVVNEWIGV